MHHSVHSSAINSNQDMEATLVSINRRMDEDDVAHTYSEILLSHKNEWNNATCSNMDRSKDYHTKWSKPDRERQIPYDAYMWNLKYDTKELIYKTETES